MGKIPENIRYTRDHEWAALDAGAGLVTVGITQYAAEKLGDVVFVELPEVGTEVEADETYGSVESTKAVSDLFCPLAGKIEEVNDGLEDNPELVSEDPFDEGWLMKLSPRDIEDYSSLMSSEDYEAFTAGLENE